MGKFLRIVGKILRISIGIILILFSIYEYLSFAETNWIIFFVIGICFFIPDIVYVIKRHRTTKELQIRTEEVTNLAKILLENKYFQKEIPTIAFSVFLKDDEKAYIEETTKLYQPHRHTVRYAGAIRGVKGVYIGESIPKIYNVVIPIDSGTLILTNKWLIFNGISHTKSIEIDKIISVDILEDAISVAEEGKEKENIFYVWNPLMWKTWIFYLRTGWLPPETKVDVINKNNM